jgi:hypothetical protein
VLADFPIERVGDGFEIGEEGYGTFEEWEFFGGYGCEAEIFESSGVEEKSVSPGVVREQEGEEGKGEGRFYEVRA